MPSERTALDNRQAALINMIFSGIQSSTEHQFHPAEQGIQIYRDNLLITATRALCLNYPVIEKMLGPKTMGLLTQQLLEIELPNSGDWADFGKSLPALINKAPLQQEHPYLETTAKLEWNLKQAARSTETNLDIASLSHLSDTDLGKVYIQLGENINLLTSAIRVDELWRIHQPGRNKDLLNSESLLTVLTPQDEPYWFVIYQKDHLPCIKSISETEYRWFSAIQSGHNLSELLGQFHQFDFSQWLSEAIEQQWLKKLSKR
ncbi:putative DNA-binding domain-containing protein [Neptuniibacter sp. PT8_73]|uniref:HvfC/BufC family peptide modification chaperone n=1 Tax=Neptuniibacter sp. PT8_73 TaxID=3398206 RepID=UPI0039F61152